MCTDPAETQMMSDDEQVGEGRTPQQMERVGMNGGEKQRARQKAEKEERMATDSGRRMGGET